MLLKFLIPATLLLFANSSLLMAGPNEAVVIRGHVINGGVNCALIQTDEGEVLALAGLNYKRFPVGTQLKIEGLRIKRSTCQQIEMAFRINKILSADGLTQNSEKIERDKNETP